MEKATVFVVVLFFLFRKADCHVQPLVRMCLESWKPDYPTFSYQWTLRACLQVQAGERSYLYTLDRGPGLSWGEGHPLPQSMTLREGSTWKGEGEGAN